MTRYRHALVSAAVVLVLLATGCARRPAITQAAAPPPTGAPVAVAPPPPAPAPAPVAAQPPAPAPAQPAPAPAPVETARPAPKEFVAAPQLPDIYFDFDKFTIRPAAAKTLQASAEWMSANPNHAMLIEGHCDERGTDAYNLALGDRRAKAAMDFLVAHGVPAGRINVVSFGKERPACSEKNEDCWSRNRRAHFVLKAQ